MQEQKERGTYIQTRLLDLLEDGGHVRLVRAHGRLDQRKCELEVLRLVCSRDGSARQVHCLGCCTGGTGSVGGQGGQSRRRARGLASCGQTTQGPKRARYGHRHCSLRAVCLTHQCARQRASFWSLYVRWRYRARCGVGLGAVSRWRHGWAPDDNAFHNPRIPNSAFGNASRRPRPAQSGRSCRRPLPLAPPAALQRPSQHPNCTSRYTLVLQPTRTPSGTHTARYRLENSRAGKSYMEAIHLRI